MKKAYKYSWTRSFAADAQAVGEWIQRQKVKTDAALAESARDPSSPAHGLFQWDDTAAAVEYRLIQARIIKASLRVEVVNAKGKAERVIAFISTAERGRYVPTLEASDEDLSEAEQNCWRQMRVFRDRYKSFEIARAVVAAINDTDASLRRRRKKAA